MNVLVFLLVVNIINTTLGSREKRLVLHSDVDIATEVSNLRADLEKEKVSNNQLRTDLAKLQAAFDSETKNDHGSVYVRWGRTMCPGNGSTLIYKGYMAGSEYTEKGNGANHLCLPEDPTWAHYTDASDGGRSNINGAEFEDVAGDVYFGKHVTDQDIPCAVCQIPAVSVMIPARTNCYPGWTLEYTGYLMASYVSYSTSEYVCIDADPEFVPRGHASTNGHLLYLVQSKCGTLVCPPYYDYRELACAVCSK